MTSWLRDGLSRVLSIPQSDAAAFSSAYDDCLWRIITSAREDLAELVHDALTTWYGVPIPLLVAAARLYGAESAHEFTAVETAINFIKAHCDPVETKMATGGITAQVGRMAAKE